ncbi:MAG: NapC/NirT family cytochrome c [Marinilabiliales bacterium]|nr:NapC/NirT family cytochrome c [Marinilabiliales bacterium]
MIVILGAFTGLFFLLLKISNATSYLSDDPRVCINCHIMTPQFATWSHSAHRSVTDCNACHVPHDSFVRKYYFKASDGLRHSNNLHTAEGTSGHLYQGSREEGGTGELPPLSCLTLQRRTRHALRSHGGTDVTVNVLNATAIRRMTG